MDRENIFLIGFMGVGKSTVAGALKERLGYKRVEMDQRIEENRGMTIADIFARYGEAYLSWEMRPVWSFPAEAAWCCGRRTQSI